MVGVFMSDRWYVLQTKPNKEKIVLNQVMNQQIQCYFPQIRVKPLSPRGRKTIPYFPEYIFLAGQPDTLSISTRWLAGAKGLVYIGGEIAWISDLILAKIRENVDTWNLSMENKHTPYKKGDIVEIVEGPFAKYSAIFDTEISGTERAKVLLQLMGDQSIRIELPINFIKFDKNH